MYNIARNDVRKFLSVGNAQNDQLRWGDEPTYLSFNYKFYFESLDGNIDINDTGQFDGSGLSNLLLPDSNINAATNYLRRINRPKHANMLQTFIDELRNIQKEKPWTFTTINGLDGLMASNQNLRYMEADKSISVEYNETLDMQDIHPGGVGEATDIPTVRPGGAGENTEIKMKLTVLCADEVNNTKK
jgi:hypothetical protein